MAFFKLGNLVYENKVEDFQEDDELFHLLIDACTQQEEGLNVKTKIQKFFEKNKLDVNDLIVKTGEAPVHVVAKQGNIQVLEILIELGAKVGRSTSAKQTVLHCAIQGVKDGTHEKKALRFLKYVLQKYEFLIDFIDGSFKSAVYLASTYQLWKIVEYMIKNKAYIDHDIKSTRQIINEYAPELATNVTKKEKRLVHFNSYSYLSFLLSTSKVDEFLFFLENYYIDEILRTQCRSLLQETALHGCIKIASKLIEMGSDVNEYSVAGGLTALHYAVKLNHLKYTEFLLNNGSNINAQCKIRKETPLHRAILVNNQDIIRLLLKKNANIFLKNALGQTVLCLLNDDDIKYYLDQQIFERHVYSCNFTCLTFDYHVLIDQFRDKMIPGHSEMKILKIFAKSQKLKKFLKHPLIKSFLYLKWYHNSWIFWTTLFFHILFTSILSYKQMCDLKFFENIGVLNILWSILSIMYVASTAWKTLLFFQNCYYLITWEKLLEISFSIVVILILLEQFQIVGEIDNLPTLVVLLSYSNLFLNISRHPSLAIHLTMFFRVSQKVFWYFIWYSPLIISFNIVFYISDYNQHKNGNNSSIVSFPVSLIKTFSMMVGEYEINELPIALHTTQIVLFLFIFFITIVFMNLLNAVAISDTNEIKNQSEIINSIAEIEYYDKLEILLRVNKLFIKHFSHRFAKSVAHRLFILSGKLSDRKCTVKIYHDTLKVKICDDLESNKPHCCSMKFLKFIKRFKNICYAKGEFKKIIDETLIYLSKKDSLTGEENILKRLQELETKLNDYQSSQLQRLQNIERMCVRLNMNIDGEHYDEPYKVTTIS